MSAATLALDALLCRVTPEVTAAARLRAPLHLVDQLDAATRDARALAAVGMHPVRRDDVRHTDAPEWLRLGAVDTLRQWLDGTGRTCTHDPHPERPAPVVAAAWRPGLVSCVACAPYLLRLTGEADARCDRCGHVTAGLDAGEGIHPCRLLLGPLVYAYGVCADCLESGEARE